MASRETYPTVKAPRWVLWARASETDPSITGREGRSVGICTRISLIIDFPSAENVNLVGLFNRSFWVLCVAALPPQDEDV